MAENRLIGRGGELPWHISADLRRFKKITTGHTIIMGRKTYESIGRPLPKRRSIVISRNPSYAPSGVEVANSLTRALEMSADEDEVFIIGGSSIYDAALPFADRLLVTQVQGRPDGDTFFPEFDSNHWRVTEESEPLTDEKQGLTFSYVSYQRSET